MRFGSLFSGIGGFDLAFENVGMTTEFQVEIDPRCGELLGKRFPGVPLYTDIAGVKGDQFVDIDLLCGGFPCQDISNAGRRAGLAGARSGLWWEYRRLLEEVRPEWCVIENVAGLLSSGGRRDLGAILGALGDLGYGWAYRVLDAQWFGVPQRRRRVFIVGHLGDRRAPSEVLLEPEGLRGDPPPSREAGEAVAALARSGVGTCGADDNQAQAGHLLQQTIDWQVAGSGRTWIHDKPGGPCRSLTSGKTMAVLEPMTVGLGSDVIHATNLAQPVPRRNGDPGVVVVPALTARCGNTQDDQQTLHLTVHPIDKPTPVYYTHDYSRDRVYDGGGICEALNTTRQPNFLVEHTVRRLTPLECERLQGFPDGWTEGFSDNARYRMLGNAVAVPVVQWIGRRIMEVAA